MVEQVRPEYFGSRTIRLSDPFSPLPLTPSTPLIGKTKLVLPPPGKFQRGILTENITGGAHRIFLTNSGTDGVKNIFRSYS